MIVFDEDGDGLWSVMFSERVLIINLTFDGTKRSVTDDIPWNGEVLSMHSDDGYIFDHYADDPEVYLFTISVSDGRNSARNWNPATGIAVLPAAARAFITPVHTKPEFHVTAISIVSTPAKGKYVASLAANVLCQSGDGPAIEYIGRGKWVQVLKNGSEVMPQMYNCCVDAAFGDSEDGMGTASGISVGPGTYRFYVTLIWSGHYSFVPSTIFDEVTVP